MDFPTHLLPSVIQNFLLGSILLNSHFLKYPPSAQYQTYFWKWVIQHLESSIVEEDFEIDSRIYEHYLSISGLAYDTNGSDTRSRCFQLSAPPTSSYVTHFWKIPSQAYETQALPGIVDSAQYETTTLLESRTTIESGTTGLRTWPASFALSQYLIDHSDLVNGKKVLELGSGIGFLGIIVGSLQQRLSLDKGKSSLWLTDVNEEVLIKCRNNIQIPYNHSSLHPNISYRLLDWSTLSGSGTAQTFEDFYREEINADLVLGADLIFEPTLLPALVATIKFCLQSRLKYSPTTALIAVTVRNQDTFKQFLDIVEKEGLSVMKVEKDSDQNSFFESDNARDDVKILQFTA